MAVTVRRSAGLMLPLALIYAKNKQIASLVGTKFHADVSRVPSTSGNWSGVLPAPLQVSPTSAIDVPSAIVLANAIWQTISPHMFDGITTSVSTAATKSQIAGNGAHQAPDTTNQATIATAMGGGNYVSTGNAGTDQTNLITIANSMKAAINAHFTQAGIHYNNDGTNTIVAANASTLPTLLTLLAAIATSVNAHILNGPAAPQIAVWAA